MPSIQITLVKSTLKHFFRYFLSAWLLYLFSPCVAAFQDNARQAVNLGQYEQAIQLWRRQLQQEDDPRLHLHIAQFSIKLGLYQAAERALEQARKGISDKDPTLFARWHLVYSQLLAAQNHDQYAVAWKHLQQASMLDKQIHDPLLLAEILKQKGNLHSAGGNYSKARDNYQAALELLENQQGAEDSRSKIFLNHTRALVMQQIYTAPNPGRMEDFHESLQSLRQATEILSSGEDIYQQVFAYLQLFDLAEKIQSQISGSSEALQRIMQNAVQQAVRLAEQLAHPHAKGHAYAASSRWYFGQNQFDTALTQIRRALFFIAQEPVGWKTSQWLRLKGQILYQQNRNDDALDAYRQAIQQLKPLRRKLVNTGFRPPEELRAQLAPVYFEFADLALQQAANKGVNKNELLIEAREAIEHFKQAELQDYFRSSCITAQSNCALLDELLDDTTAALYPVILPDRLELLLSLPDDMLRFRVDVSAEQLKLTATMFSSPLRRHPHPQERARGRSQKSTSPAVCSPITRGRGGKTAENPDRAFRFLPHAQKLYQWLIAPLEAQLQAHGIKNLIVVPDGILRTLPFAALHDGEQYLIERYALGISPGLCLSASQEPWYELPDMLLGGISEAVQDFSQIPCAEYELKTLHQSYAQNHPLLLNQKFQLPELQRSVAEQDYSIVHIASHGEFNADVDKSFILTYDGKLTLDKLEQLNLLRKVSDKPIELLTLSACETAKGNDRAALGLAGVALKAGAKSALASLWQVDDNATPAVIIEFYRQLQQSKLNKIQALRHAQIQLLQTEEYARYQHPYYWSAFMMIGDWH
ncbi:CHAT domain-containing protein [Candidatus Venteria ishoeyi]|uniref:CHAT domain protein n=1 Tax=Candidatus Venteria ishoeyi TaxID=1899563 RepID=A0A1H6FCP7_9GAMM|nr:CHAT domain-containing protein [Candidatus Venteria ishoeyi]SEH07860.1 CHAT domain protein [Candidatus Venteria ishoeyi]